MEMESLGMTVELDSFQEETPIFGNMNFVNIIGKVNPTADKFLTLSCHYDSKYFKDQVFVGATDSSVPCSVMLNIVKTTMPLIRKLTDGKNLGLMLLFFDGEEAFKEWTDADSLYGSRHLAQKWETTGYKTGREIDRIVSARICIKHLLIIYVFLYSKYWFFWISLVLLMLVLFAPSQTHVA